MKDSPDCSSHLSPISRIDRTGSGELSEIYVGRWIRAASPVLMVPTTVTTIISHDNYLVTKPGRLLDRLVLYPLSNRLVESRSRRITKTAVKQILRY